MKSSQLLSALKIAQPSLGTAEDVLPVLSHFCFMGDALYAYDDTTATIVELQTGLSCALHGDTLIGLLEASTSVDDVQIEQSDAGAKLDVGTGWVKVPMLHEKDFVFALPDDQPIFSLPFTDDAAKAFEACLLSVGKDALKPEFMGVTVAVVDGVLVFYSSNNASASRYQPEKKTITRTKSFAAVIPEEGCSKLLKLRSSLGRDESVKVAIGTRGAVGTFAGTPSVTLFTKVMPAKPELFSGVFTKHVDSAEQFDMPPGLANEVKKAAILLARESVKELVITFAGAKITLSATGTLGTMRTSLDVQTKLSGAVCVNPDDLLRVLPLADKLAINDEVSLIIVGGGFSHILSSRQGWSAQKKAPDKKKGPVDDLDDDIPF